MVDFSNTKSIYSQIVDIIQKKIMSGEYTENERIPSVRELSIKLAVNPSTCIRAYEILSRNNIISNKRGIGYFVNPGIKSLIIKQEKNNFLKNKLPEIIKEMKSLDIPVSEFIKVYNLDKNIKENPELKID